MYHNLNLVHVRHGAANFTMLCAIYYSYKSQSVPIIRYTTGTVQLCVFFGNEVKYSLSVCLISSFTAIYMEQPTIHHIRMVSVTVGQRHETLTVFSSIWEDNSPNYCQCQHNKLTPLKSPKILFECLSFSWKMYPPMIGLK